MMYKFSKLIIILSVCCIVLIEAQPGMASGLYLSNVVQTGEHKFQRLIGRNGHFLQVYPPPETQTPNPTGGLSSQTPTGISGTPSPASTYGTQSTTGTASTPAQTFTPTSTPSLSPTTTLMPLPAITLIFPASTKTSTATGTPEAQIGTGTPALSGDNDLFRLSPRLKVLTIVLVFLWLILVGFLIVYLRQFR
jgi:hypothetical protein